MRRVTGFVFRYLVRILLGLPFLDTQCGFEGFHREKSLSVVRQQRIDRFCFDPEFLFLADRKGLRTLELGVRWRNNPDSRVRFLQDAPRMLIDLLRIRWLSMLGRYQ